MYYFNTLEIRRINIINKFKIKVKELKTQLTALYLAYRNKEVMWYKKLFLLLVIAYAVSPIDIIPDFIPILGMLDDFIIIPLGILIAIKIIPKNIWYECTEKAKMGVKIEKKYKILGAIIISAIWALMIFALLTRLFR